MGDSCCTKNSEQKNGYQCQGHKCLAIQGLPRHNWIYVIWGFIKRKIPKFENLTIRNKKEKIVERNGQPNLTLKNCLEIELEPFCDSNLLVRILDTLSNEEPSGRYDSSLLLDVIKRVLELVKRPPKPPSKQEVIGAWGELSLLHSLIRSADSHKLQSRFIYGWEASPTNRSIIDFMFPFLNSGLALEVKTSCIGRTHHFHGLPQVTIPDDYRHGWIASLVISEIIQQDRPVLIWCRQ